MHVVFEGIDGSGKDLQADLLMSTWRDQGLNPILVREPDTEMPGGPELRSLLQSGEHPDAQLGLFLANRMALQASKVAPALQAEHPVINVRSFLSTLVYQQDQGWPLDWLFAVHNQLLCKPTHMIILDLDPEVSLARISKRGGTAEVYERLDVLRRMRHRYLDLAEDDRLQNLLDGDVLILDASGTPEEAHARVCKTLGI